MGKNEILRRFEHFPLKGKVYQLTEVDPVIESTYLAIREKEDRVLTDDEVAELPQRGRGQSNQEEWSIRAKSAKHLRDYLQVRQYNTILELGCGNGWLSNYLAHDMNTVVGVDINATELETAGRVFKQPIFGYGDIFHPGFDLSVSFDAIVIASAVQYFSSLAKLIDRLLPLLGDQGEIHIIDSPIYRDESAKVAAQSRTASYYKRLDVSMPEYYHHHSWADFSPHQYNIMYRPNSLTNRIGRWIGLQPRPFPWVMIKKARPKA